MTRQSLVQNCGVFLGRLGIFGDSSPCPLCGGTGKVRTSFRAQRMVSGMARLWT